jgi:transcriptional regulator with XRE-family HTH domain
MPPRKKTLPRRDVAPQIRRWSWRLRDLLREHGRTFREIEEELGWSSGYLSQVLAPGTPALKVEHVLQVLDVLGVAASEFFADLYGLGLPVRPEEGAGKWTIDPDQIERAVAEGARQLEERIKAEVGETVEEVQSRLRKAEEDVRSMPDQVARAAEQAAERAVQRLALALDPEQVRLVASRVVREELMRLARGEAAEAHDTGGEATTATIRSETDPERPRGTRGS